MFIQIEKAIKIDKQADCIIFNLEGMINMMDLQQLCTNEWCNYYFDQRLKYYQDGVNQCLGVTVTTENNTKEDIYINIDDLNKTNPKIYVKDELNGFVEDK
jgi:hypothetical protein